MADKETANSKDWHPVPAAAYFNTQGINHLRGINGKKESLPDAESCFRYAVKLGDNSAAFNLALLIAKGFIKGSDKEINELLEPLLKKGLIQTAQKNILFDVNQTDSNKQKELSQIVDLMMADNNIDEQKVKITGYVITLRKQLEKSLKAIILKNRPDALFQKKVMAGSLLFDAQYYLKKQDYKDLQNFLACAGSNVAHDDGSDPLDIDSKQLRHWSEIIKNLEKKYC